MVDFLLESADACISLLMFLRFMCPYAIPVLLFLNPFLTIYLRKHS